MVNTLREHLCVADRGLAISTYPALKLQRPLLLEGEAEVGRAGVAMAFASTLGADLIRLQRYEALGATHAARRGLSRR